MSVTDEIKDRIDAVELISNYVQLKRTGRNYKGLCPFHAEKTPSFVVFPETGTWHCFGACGEGGDIFTFVMKREGWDFRMALEELARQAGVELKPRTEQQVAEDQEQAKIREVLSTAAVYFNNLLLNAPQAQAAREYIARRGFQDRTVELFQLGYALDEWHALESFLIGKGYAREELIAAGLLVEREAQAGRVYDRFRGRLMIPIRDVRGRVIGFGARTLDPDGVPKYLNSPQTAVFDKSRTLYGLDNATKGIRAAERAVVVEGYMDVMQAHQAGFTDVVAQLGTALTEENLRQLTRYTKRVILALDSDTAGQAATMRGLDVAREALEPDWQPVFDARGLVRLEARLSADVRVLTLPGGQDPDDLIRHDPAQWAILVDRAVPLVEHYVRTVLKNKDLADPKVKEEITQTLIPVIRGVASPVERAHYAQRLARTLRVDERALLDMVTGASRRRPRRPRTQSAQSTSRAPGRPRVDLEIHCLRGLMQAPAVLKKANSALGQIGLEPIAPTDFDRLESREIFRLWQEMVNEDLAPTLETLSQSVPEPLHPYLQRLIDTSPTPIQNQKWSVDAHAELGQDVFHLSAEQLQQDILKSLLRLRERYLKQKSAEIRFLLEEADSTQERLYQQATHETGAALLRLQQRILAGSATERSTLNDFTNRE